MKIELKGTSISIISNGELALQRNINYGVDSAVETVRAFPEFETDWMWEKRWKYFVIEDVSIPLLT